MQSAYGFAVILSKTSDKILKSSTVCPLMLKAQLILDKQQWMTEWSALKWQGNKKR